jgi:plasmid stabilization system protein ParE
MALTIQWTPLAEETFEAIIDYLLERWTEREVLNFVRESHRVIG